MPYKCFHHALLFMFQHVKLMFLVVGLIFLVVKLVFLGLKHKSFSKRETFFILFQQINRPKINQKRLRFRLKSVLSIFFCNFAPKLIV